MNVVSDKSILECIGYIIKLYIEIGLMFIVSHKLLKKKMIKIPIVFVSILSIGFIIMTAINYWFFFEKILVINMLLQIAMVFYLLVILELLYEGSILKKLLSAILGSLVVSMSVYGMSGIILMIFGFYTDMEPVKYLEQIPRFTLYVLSVVTLESFLLFLLKKPFAIYRRAEIRNNRFFLFLCITALFIPTIMMIVSDDLKAETFFTYMFMVLFMVLIAGGLLLYYYSKDLRSQVTSFKNLYMLQSQHYEALEESIEKTEELKEDINMHVKSIQLLQEQEKECFEFESELMKRYEEVNSIIFTNNTRIDALLYYYSNLCKEKNIEFQSHMKLTIDISDFQYDVHEVLKRMLEKAWKDCKSQQDNEMKSMFIEAYYVKNCFFLRIEYSKNQVPRNVSNHYLFKFIKKHTDQMDLKPIKNICYKYNGKVDLSIEKEIHKMTTMFQMEDV